MANVVSYHSYKLQKNVSTKDFLLSVETLMNEFVSKQKGFISSKTLVDGDTWADFIVWETVEDLEEFIPLCNKNELAIKSTSMMDFATLKSHTFLVEQSF